MIIDPTAGIWPIAQMSAKGTSVPFGQDQVQCETSAKMTVSHIKIPGFQPQLQFPANADTSSDRYRLMALSPRHLWGPLCSPLVISHVLRCFVCKLSSYYSLYNGFLPIQLIHIFIFKNDDLISSGKSYLIIDTVGFRPIFVLFLQLLSLFDSSVAPFLPSFCLNIFMSYYSNIPF